MGNYENIIPRGVPAGHARVTEVEFALRTMVDYDITFMQDRVVTHLFANGKPAGPYCAMAIPELRELGRGPSIAAAEAIHRFGPETERNVIDAFLGTGWREESRALNRNIGLLQERIDHLERVRWWHLRRRWAARRRVPLDSDGQPDFGPLD